MISCTKCSFVSQFSTYPFLISMITMNNQNEMTGKTWVNSLLFLSVTIVISLCLMQILVNNLILNDYKMQWITTGYVTIFFPWKTSQSLETCRHFLIIQLSKFILIFYLIFHFSFYVFFVDAVQFQ